MTEANIEFFSTTRDRAEIVDQVDVVNRRANIPRFARFHLRSVDVDSTYNIAVRHLEKGDRVSLTLVHPLTRMEEKICDIPDGERVMVFPGPISQRAGFPRLDVQHGQITHAPTTINIVDILVERYGRTE